MKIEIRTDAKGRAIGYDFIPETSEEKIGLGTVRDLLFFGFKETVIKYNGIVLGGDGSKTPENLERLKFLQKKHVDINQLIKDVNFYKSVLEENVEWGGTASGIDQESRLFEVLDKKFNWNIDHQKNVEAMQYLNNATDIERCDYLLDIIIPSL